MVSIRSWNRQQYLVFLRFCRRHRVALTPELTLHLAVRFARKHAHERRYADVSSQISEIVALPGEPSLKLRPTPPTPSHPVGAGSAPAVPPNPLRLFREGHYGTTGPENRSR